MYLLLLTLHSWLRWAVLLALGLSLVRAYWGWRGRRAFTARDEAARHGLATLAQVQLTLGYLLYFSSPVVQAFRLRGAGAADSGALFFGLLHVATMTLAVGVLTIGAALARRRTGSAVKFRTLALWLTAALLLVLLAIPWPFSPLAARPYFRF